MESQRIEFTTTRKRWAFPEERFVAYEPSDEDWCRPLGNGHEVTEETKVVIPRAVMTRITPEGIEFVAYPEHATAMVPIAIG